MKLSIAIILTALFLVTVASKIAMRQVNIREAPTDPEIAQSSHRDTPATAPNSISGVVWEMPRP
jgi:hypothetical protein